MERLSGNFLLLSVFVDISLDNICTFNHAGILVKKVDSASKSQETFPLLSGSCTRPLFVSLSFFFLLNLGWRLWLFVSLKTTFQNT